jgi:hypothetical protein
VVDAVKEFLQVHIDHHAVPLLHIALRLLHRSVRTAPGPEPVAVRAEARIDARLQYLQQGLLDQPIHHRRNPQLPCPAAQLRNRYPAYRTRPVTAVEQSSPNDRPLRSEVLRRLLHRASIDAGTPAIGFDTFPCRRHVVLRQRLREQVLWPPVRGGVPRQPGFIACTLGLGFTSPPLLTPRLRGLLMPCSTKRHAASLSFSFGPSPNRSDYYGRC